MPSEFETVITDQTEYGTVITAQGAAIIADCILNGKKLPIVEAAAGDGGGEATVPTTDQTALVNERWRGAIAGKSLSPTTPNMIDVKIVIGDDVGGFTIREMGLYSDTGVLIAVCNTPVTERVPISDGVSGKLTLIMHIVVADASVLEFSINPSLDMVSRQELGAELDSHNTDPEAHLHLTELLGEVEPQEGAGAPTEQTEGLVGQKYTVTGTGAVYTCITVSLGEDGGKRYTWVPGRLGTLEEIRAALSAKANITQLYNDNLLINWYFVGGGSQQGGGQFPINQRGKTEYVGGEYCIDRWINTSTGTVKLLKNGLVFTTSVMFDQRIEKSLLTAGQVVTASIFVNGEVYSNTFKLGDGNWTQVPFGDSGLNMRCLTQESSYSVFGIFSTDSYDGAPIKAAKFELGPIQTIAHKGEDGNWVLNDPPPNYELEIEKCQRYQLALSGGVDGYGVVAIGHANLSTNAYVLTPTPVTMREGNGAVIWTGNWVLSDGTKEHAVTDIGLARSTQNSILLGCKVSGGLTVNSTYMLQAKSDPTAKILIDKNL